MEDFFQNLCFINVDIAHMISIFLQSSWNLRVINITSKILGFCDSFLFNNIWLIVFVNFFLIIFIFVNVDFFLTFMIFLLSILLSCIHEILNRVQFLKNFFTNMSCILFPKLNIFFRIWA